VREVDLTRIFETTESMSAEVQRRCLPAVVAVALLGFYFLGLWRVAGLEAEAARLEGRETALMTQLAGIDPSLSMNRRVETQEDLRKLNGLDSRARHISAAVGHGRERRGFPLSPCVIRIAFAFDDRDGDAVFDATRDQFKGLKLEPRRAYRWPD